MPQDFAKAREWYEKAAAQGDATGQFNLGVMYHNGEGVPQDYSRAREWFEKAAAQGHAAAHKELAFLFFEGKGVPQDYVQAYAWANIAAAAGTEGAQGLRDLLASKMDAAVLMRAQALSREYFEKYGKTE